ncbi:Uncharacterized small protein, DUF1192 family [Devosia enhydra]|uniref:Uncharacterized small protein, DUF1192 family n=1 Tax=Devosia enhydra TaxID=665118 RepID=A0A1K2HWX5_9HYPH|nr:DUF1192 domain-containing protein [Devosia enhydra]SFZ83642.1 Uncharacterized small protein, DUF1192 family [Devosia enhydra]
MDEDARRGKPVSHDLGMVIDTLSAEELEWRIGLLEAEIARLRAAIGERRSTRAAAEALFKL